MTSEHETIFHFVFGDEVSGWIRTPSPHVERRSNANRLDGRWRTLRSGPYLTSWPDGSRRPELASDDGWPSPGLAVGNGFVVGESFFSEADHWYSTVVIGIERVERVDLPADVLQALVGWRAPSSWRTVSMTHDHAEPPALVDLVAPYYTAERAAQLLGLTANQLTVERSTGRILGVDATGGDTFYPTLQFAIVQGYAVVKPGLVSFFQALQARQPWTIAVYLKTPADKLDDLTPEQWVDQGRDLQTLLGYAQIINAEMERP